MKKMLNEVNQINNFIPSNALSSAMDHNFDTFFLTISSKGEQFLKVPKREIFDRSDFPDFYTIKSLRVGDFGVKIKKVLQNI